MISCLWLWWSVKYFVYILQEDVDSFMKQPGNDTADAVLRKLDEQYQKYKYMELNLAQKKQRCRILTQCLNHWSFHSSYFISYFLRLHVLSLKPEVCQQCPQANVVIKCLIIAPNFCSDKNVCKESRNEQ